LAVNYEKTGGQSNDCVRRRMAPSDDGKPIGPQESQQQGKAMKEWANDQRQKKQNEYQRSKKGGGKAAHLVREKRRNGRGKKKSAETKTRPSKPRRRTIS